MEQEVGVMAVIIVLHEEEESSHEAMGGTRLATGFGENAKGGRGLKVQLYLCDRVLEGNRCSMGPSAVAGRGIVIDCNDMQWSCWNLWGRVDIWVIRDRRLMRKAWLLMSIAWEMVVT